MNIGIITTGFPTPYEPGKYAFVDQLACAWADMGNIVTVVYPIPAFVELFDKRRFYKSKWVRKTSKNGSINVLCPRFFSASDKVFLGIETKKLAYRSFQRAVIKSLTNNKGLPDVLYGHFLPSGCQAGDIGKKMSIPSFCAFGESSLWSIKGWNIDEIRDSLSKLSGIVSVSTENKRILIEQELFREKDIEVFPNGVDHSLFKSKNKQAIRAKYGFPEDAFIGIYTGAFNNDKGVLRAQEASILAEKTYMIYIGDGQLKPEGSNILFRRRLEHEKIPEYLNAADFFILPTKAEGCCNAIIEAMACGLPIISSDGAYNDDILSEEYAIRTNPEDIPAMTEAIRRLRDDSIQRNKMSIAAITASNQFDIQRRACAILDFIQKKTQEG